jgi:hypothetical protein
MAVLVGVLLLLIPKREAKSTIPFLYFGSFEIFTAYPPNNVKFCVAGRETDLLETDGDIV